MLRGASPVMQRTIQRQLKRKRRQPSHKPGDVWKTEGGWRSMSPKGDAKTFKDKGQAETYAGKGKADKGKGPKSQSPGGVAKGLNAAASDPKVGEALKEKLGDKSVELPPEDQADAALNKMVGQIGGFIGGALVGGFIGAVGGLGGLGVGALVLGMGLLTAFAEGDAVDKERASKKAAGQSVKMVDLIQKGLKNVKPADVELAQQFTRGDKFDSKGFWKALKEKR